MHPSREDLRSAPQNVTLVSDMDGKTLEAMLHTHSLCRPLHPYP